MIIDGYEDCAKIIEQVARAKGAGYKKHGPDADDMRQECWIWVLQNPHKIEQWRSEGLLGVMLGRTLRNECTDVGEAAKSQQGGVSKEDRMLDARDAAKNRLAEIFDADVIASVEAGAGKVTHPWRGGAWNPEILRTGFLGLAESEDKLIIEAFYRDGWSNRRLAEHLGIPPQTMSYRHDRALRRLVRAAGGVQGIAISEDEDDPAQFGWVGRRAKSSKNARDEITDDYAYGFDG